MVQCEPPPRKIKSNSLAKDKELTDMVRNMSRRFRLRIEDIQQKADDLEVAAKAVKDRVICSESRMVHLKNYKTVNQVISTENIPKKEKKRPREDDDFVMTDEMIDSYMTQFKELSKTFHAKNNQPVIARPNIRDYVNGVYTNGHATNGVVTNGMATNGLTTNGYGHAPSTDGSHHYLEDEYESDESRELPAQNGTFDNIPPAPLDFPAVIPVHPFRDRESPPPPLEQASPSPTPTNDATYIENFEEPIAVNPMLQRDLGPEETPEPVPPPPVQKAQTRPPALASVINEMKAKVAAQPRYVDSDSDPDTEPLRGGQRKPSTSSQPPEQRNHLAQEKLPTAVPRTRQLESTSASTIEQPPPLQKPNLPARNSKNEEKECKIVDTIFDSDSDTEPLNQPATSTSSQKPVPRNMVAHDKLPQTTRQPEPVAPETERPSKSEKPPPAQPNMSRKAASTKENERKVSDIFDSDSEPETTPPKRASASASKQPQPQPPKAAASSAPEVEKPKKIYFLNLPPKEERGPWKIPPKVAAARAAKEAAEKEAAAKEAAAKKSHESKKAAQPAVAKPFKKETTVKVGKSLFSSDSDSDDEFLKSFSKKKPSATPAIPTATASKAAPITKPEPKVVKKPDDVPVTKVADAPPAAPVSISSSTSATTTTTSKVETKVETTPEPKVEIKKPKSLFDDSDSDSDLFSTSNKPKPLKSTRESIPVTASPKMDPPITSEQIEPTTRAAKKEATSETMSAKISLIADLQKTFRLPGTPPPTITAKKSDNEEPPREEETATTTILKSRVRGPANRRPPTRPNVSN